MELNKNNNKNKKTKVNGPGRTRNIFMTVGEACVAIF